MKIKKVILAYFFYLLAISSLNASIGNDFFEEHSMFYIIKNKHANLLINKKTFLLELQDTKGNVHYSEYQVPEFKVNEENWIYISEVKESGSNSQNEVEFSFSTKSGETLILQVKKAGDYGFKMKYNIPDVQVSKTRGKIKLNPVEEIYGFGETWNGELSQRGELIEIWDKSGTPDECAWMPYFVSTNNYSFFLSYGGKVTFDIGRGNANELVYELPTDELEYTVILGENIASSVQNFVKLTGLPVKPPRWTFKPWFWLMGDPEIPGSNISTLQGKHFIEMVEKLNEMNIPVGATWLEPPWQTARTTFIPNKEFSPDLKGLISDLDKLGVKTLAWTVPYTSPDASNWDEAVQNGYLVKKPGGAIDDSKLEISNTGELEGIIYNKIDFFNPEAFEWWKAQIEKSLDLGLKGYKLDAGQGLPPDAILYGGIKGKDVRNSYAREYNKVFYQALSSRLGDDFLMIPRAAWIGSAAYTNFKWPGDLSGTFANNGLPSSVYSSLSLALSGIPFVSTDIGGFVNKPPQELPWIRWAQFGSMLPGMQTLHMPWWYSDEAAEHFRYLTWLHTDLIPYWETLANEAHNNGTPVCRPLVWNYQEDQNTWYVDDEYTVGDYLLVAPIINPERMRDVYLPKGKWFNFWDDELIEGGQNVIFNESIYKFPLYVKGGAVIPMEIQNGVTGFGSEHSKDFITLAVWPEKDAINEFILNDREGEIPIITTWKEDNKILIELKESSQDYIFRIHLQGDKVPENIFGMNGEIKLCDDMDSFNKSMSNCWYFDHSTDKLWVKKFSITNFKFVEINLK